MASKIKFMMQEELDSLVKQKKSKVIILVDLAVICRYPYKLRGKEILQASILSRGGDTDVPGYSFATAS